MVTDRHLPPLRQVDADLIVLGLDALIDGDALSAEDEARANVIRRLFIPDTRIVYAVRCTWWDSIDKAATTDGTPTGLPCCPTCRSPLMEVPDEASWWAGAEEHEAHGHPGYVAKLRWLRGQHFPTWPAADVAYVEYLATLPLDPEERTP